MTGPATTSHPRASLDTCAVVPRVSWLFTDWRMRIIVPTVACLGYITHIYGIHSFAHTVESIQSELFHVCLRGSFGSAGTLGRAIRASWYFALIAHTLEGIYVLFICLSLLKLNVKTAMSWFLLTCLVGFPSTERVLKLKDGMKRK